MCAFESAKVQNRFMRQFEQKLRARIDELDRTGGAEIDDVAFLASVSHRCRWSPCKRDPITNCAFRCDRSYWHRHGQAVGELMARVAQQLGTDRELYRATGALHDLDYLAFPHDVPGPTTDWNQSQAFVHPLPLALSLEALNAPADMILAILAHAPHTGVEPASLLGHALRVTDVWSTWKEGHPDEEAPDADRYPNLAALAPLFANVAFAPSQDTSTLRPAFAERSAAVLARAVSP